MSDPATILKALRDAGFVFRLEGETLFVSPAEKLSDDDRAIIRECKAALVEAIQSEEWERHAEQAARWAWYADPFKHIEVT